MKKIIIISSNRSTSINLGDQLKKIFGNYAKIESYYSGDSLDIDTKDAMLVISSKEAIDKKIDRIIKTSDNYIIGRREVNHKSIFELVDLPNKTEILLVNDSKETTEQVISDLKILGINHIEYFPYYPGIEKYPEIEIAVTVGEPDLVPNRYKQVIDIGNRQFDITTLINIAIKLELTEILGDSIYYGYVQEIVELLKKINSNVKDMETVSTRLQTIANHMSNAIIYVNKKREIILSNQEWNNIFGYSDEEVIGKDINKIIPEMLNIKSEHTTNIIEIQGKELFVTSKSVKGKDSEDGIIYTFEKSEQIEKNEHEIRRMNSSKAIRSNYYTFKDIIYESESMEKLINKAKAYARTDSNILIQGESGTGKELISQSIHSVSQRSREAFVPVNFASMPSSLIESELFGYEEGSFTGAIKGGKRGLFEIAHGGTIFLDEIGDASLEFQGKLLRVIQERQVRRIGGSQEIPVNVRIIAATNKDLVEEINKGNFRADLYYRLNVLPLRMLNLKERKSDILILTNYFLKQYSKGEIQKIEQVLRGDAINEIYNYDWPGNIRQLENTIEYIVCIYENNKKLSKKELPEYITDSFSESEDSILVDILGKDMVWILKKIANSDGLGRRNLAESAIEEGVLLTEGQIRALLNDAQSMGLVQSSTGRKGTILTKKGYDALAFIKDNSF